MRQGRGSEATEAVFYLKAKKNPHTGVRTGCQYLISLSLCEYVCTTFVVFLISRAVRGQFPQTRDLWKRSSVGERVGHVSSHAVLRWSRSPGCSGFRGVFSVKRIFCHFFFSFFFVFDRTRPTASMRPPCLIYLATSILLLRSN